MKKHEELEAKGMNTCDECGKEEYTDYLVWITAEGFTPKEGEVVPDEAYKKYDALCESCYLVVIGT